jgi:hypothetical protein
MDQARGTHREGWVGDVRLHRGESEGCIDEEREEEAQPVVDLVSLPFLDELGEVASLDASRVLIYNGADGLFDLQYMQGVGDEGSKARTGHGSIYTARRDQTR